MSTIKVTRQIQAPVEEVFRTVSDIRNFSKAVPKIVDVEFLSEIKSGVGTRVKETREFKGREVATVLEVTKFVENDHIRIVSDTQGTIWILFLPFQKKMAVVNLLLRWKHGPINSSQK